MTNTLTQLPDYQAALQEAVFIVQPEQGFLRISGADRLDFINRQTTNDIHLLNPGRVVTTVLTTPTARMQDILTLVDEGESFGAITLAGHAAATAQLLRGKIFFMDKVAVEDVSAQVVQIDLAGPEAESLLRNIGIVVNSGQDAVVTADFAGNRLWVVATKGLGGPGYRMLASSEIAEALQVALVEAGFMPLSQENAEILRIETGLPASDSELSEEYNPLEAGLDDAISQSKGCYTGQEIIARQITYDKVTKQLVGLRLEALVEPGSQVEVEGKTVGTVTSVADSPRFGAIALAYLKRPHNQAGTQVSVVAPTTGPVSAHVVSLPFAL